MNTENTLKPVAVNEYETPSLDELELTAGKWGIIRGETTIDPSHELEEDPEEL